MNKEQIIEGLKFTKEMFLLDPITNETMTKDQLNDMDRTTVDACEGAIEILQSIPPEHDGCKDCKHEIKSDGEYPCSYCKQNYKDMWEKKPHWIDLKEDNEITDDDMWRYSCSSCHQQNYRKTTFCPNCGCRMIER